VPAQPQRAGAAGDIGLGLPGKVRAPAARHHALPSLGTQRWHPGRDLPAHEATGRPIFASPDRFLRRHASRPRAAATRRACNPGTNWSSSRRAPPGRGRWSGPSSDGGFGSLPPRPPAPASRDGGAAHLASLSILPGYRNFIKDTTSNVKISQCTWPCVGSPGSSTRSHRSWQPRSGRGAALHALQFRAHPPAPPGTLQWRMGRIGYGQLRMSLRFWTDG
jgi:hypothetical protein